MQKFIVLTAALFLFCVSRAKADGWSTYEAIQTSFSDVATAGPVMVSSAPLRWVAMNVSSYSTQTDACIVIYRSTHPTFNNQIATQTRINCNTDSFSAGPTTPDEINLWGVINTSYTYVQRVGNCMATLYFTWPEPFLADEGRTKFFGLPITGRRDQGTLPQ